MIDKTGLGLDAETRSRLIDAELGDRELHDWQTHFANDPQDAEDMALALADEARMRHAVADNQATFARTVAAPHVSSRGRSTWWAVAAGVAGIVIGLGGAQLLPESLFGGNQDEATGDWMTSLQHALETQASGTMVALPGLADQLGTAMLEIERTYQAADGRFCRAYRQSLETSTGTLATSGIACRQPDGAWQLFDLGVTNNA